MEISTVVYYLLHLLVFAVLAIYAERKISAFIQDRYGPMETGKYGILQTVADLLKLLQKEDIVPAKAEKWLFKASPLILFTFVFTGFSVLPVTSSWTGASFSSGLYFLLAIVSLDVIAIIAAGFASNNKYSIIGSMRSAAQMVSYEVPLTLSVLPVIMLCQTMDLQDISLQQSVFYEGSATFFSIPGWDVTGIGGFLSWNIFRMPVLFLSFIIFFIATLAEANRAPFDLPEAESELVAGFHTEYSGFRWSVIMLAEYGLMLLVSILAVILFFGSWSSPLPNIGSWEFARWTTGEPGTTASFFWGIIWITLKAWMLVTFQIWIRWTFPRVRIDQLMTFSWKFLTPVGLILIFITGIWQLLTYQ